MEGNFTSAHSTVGLTRPVLTGRSHPHVVRVSWQKYFATFVLRLNAHGVGAHSFQIVLCNHQDVGYEYVYNNPSYHSGF